MSDLSGASRCSKTVAGGCTQHPRDSTGFNERAANAATRSLTAPPKSASFNSWLDLSSKLGAAGSSPAGRAIALLWNPKRLALPSPKVQTINP